MAANISELRFVDDDANAAVIPNLGELRLEDIPIISELHFVDNDPFKTVEMLDVYTIRRLCELLCPHLAKPVVAGKAFLLPYLKLVLVGDPDRDLTPPSET